MSSTLLTVLLFSCTILSVWYRERYFSLSLWEIGSLITLICALWGGLISPIALLWLGIAYCAVRFADKIQSAPVKLLGGTGLFIYLLAMGLNLLPGFEKFNLVPSQTLGQSNTPFALDYSLAKPFAGLFVFAFLARKTESLHECTNLLFSKKLAPAWIIPSFVLIGIALLAGLKMDVKWLAWFPLFILTNLTMTVIQEEAFFKCFIQEPLQRWKGNRYWILLVAALPFALLHTPKAGVNPFAFYALLLVAGAAYAWPYFKTRKIESALATHWLVNVIHILLLTYPLAI